MNFMFWKRRGQPIAMPRIDEPLSNKPFNRIKEAKKKKKKKKKKKEAVISLMNNRTLGKRGGRR